MWWRHPILALALDAYLKAEGNKERELSAAPGICPNHFAPAHNPQHPGPEPDPSMKCQFLALTSVSEGCLTRLRSCPSVTQGPASWNMVHAVCLVSGSAVREGRERKPRPNWGIKNRDQNQVLDFQILSA